MSAIAGKVAPVPKGEWDSSTTYEKLNIVTHDDAVYIAKAESTNVEPSSSETTYWMLLEDLNGVTTRLTTAENDIDTLETTTSTLSSDLDTAEASITTINSTIGSETLETTAQTLTGAVNELLEDTETNATNISGLTSAITDEFDSTATYAVGDHFIYDNVIYTVDVACTGITPPNTSYYTATTVAELIEDNASDISTLNSNLTELSTIEDITSTFMGSSSVGSVVTSQTSVHKIGNNHIIGDVTFAFDSAMGTAQVNLARLTYPPANNLIYNCFGSTGQYGTTAWTPVYIGILSTNGTIQVRDYLDGTETYLHFHLDYITS